MAERDRLRGLQMRETRHDSCGVHFCFRCERELQTGQRAIEAVDLVADVETEIGRDLIVSRARGMQPPGSRADQILQRLSTFMCTSSSWRENLNVPASISARI